LTNGLGSGKSIVLASIVERLETMSDDATTAVVQYLDCASVRGLGVQNTSSLDVIKRSTISGERGSSHSIRIQNTLISQLWDLLLSWSTAAEPEDPTLLELFHDIFQNPKKKGKVVDALQESNVQDSIPTLSEAYGRAAALVRTRYYIVLDSLDEVEAPQCDLLLSSLRELVGREGLQARVILSCRSPGKVYNQIHGSTIGVIPLDKNNSRDIDFTIRKRLERMPGWSQSEREEAHRKVVEKAGSDFRYVNDIAMPYLQQAWQRPLSNHLKGLPEGIFETYTKSLKHMAPNYLSLLKTALTWKLMSDFEVTVTEIFDAYSGSYSPDDPEDGIYGYDDSTISQAHADLVAEAAGPFLNIAKKRNRHVVELKDEDGVRKFFLQQGDHNPPDPSAPVMLCANCKSDIGPHHPFLISEKVGHLTIALTNCKYLIYPDMLRIDS
jgi:hypothetical protein